MNKPLQIAIATSTLVSSLCITTSSFASGFAIIENSASGMGQAFAGAAAVAEDPSTIFFNPAGMMYLEGTQITAGMHIIKSEAEFEDNGSTNLAAYGVSQGGNGGDAGDTFYVPNFYYVREFGGKYRFGLGVNAPFGLGTEYKNGWMGRYTSTSSELKSINFNPSVAFRANEKLSIGLGANLQYLEATLENDIYFGPGNPEGNSKLNGDSWAFGFNGGFIYEILPTTRIGVHYRSEISHTLEGDVEITLPVSITKIDASAKLKTPSTFSISLTHDVNDQLTLLGDVTHSSWSSFEELKVTADASGTVLSLVEEKWSDSYRVALGMKYKYNQQWTLRTGVAHDETPIDDKYRTSRIPGDDRTWLSFGASFSPNHNLTIDVGYSHLWVEDAKIDEDYNITPAPGNEGTLKGDFDADVDILSVQATWKF